MENAVIEHEGRASLKKKTFKALKNKCWKLFSEYLRRSYADASGFSNCFTCHTRAEWKSLQCGHAIGGRHNAVLFDLSICRPQCARCNIFQRGNYPIFTTKLIQENGLSWWLQKLEDSKKIVKYTRSDIEEKISYLTERLSELR